MATPSPAASPPDAPEVTPDDTTPVCVTVQMPRWLRDQARELAEAEALPLSSYIRVVVLRHVRRRER